MLNANGVHTRMLKLQNKLLATKIKKTKQKNAENWAFARFIMYINIHYE